MRMTSLPYTEIEYIAISDFYILYDDNVLDCESVVIKTDSKFYKIQNTVNEYGKIDFLIEQLDTFQSELWPRRIVSTREEPIYFIQKEEEPDSPLRLRFEIGDRPILITADDDCLMVGIAYWDKNGLWIDFDNDLLLNDQK